MVELERRTGWPAFAGWILVGACGAIVLAAAPSFGLLVVPVAGAAAVLAAYRLRSWPEALGLGEGIGIVLLVVALVNRDYRSCPSNGVLTLAPGQQSVSCGGLDPAPFTVLGLTVCVAAAVAYGVAARRR